jgi:hypothetical protein
MSPAPPNLAAEHSIPLSTVTFSGHRYVVQADLGLPEPVPLMVHGNARTSLQLTHGVAERLTGGPIAKEMEYGYTERGRGSISAPVLRLGGATFDDLPEVPVFDFTDEPDAPVQGMLGVGFLAAARAAVDFDRDALLLGAPLSDEPDAGLLARSYRSVSMSIADDLRVTIEAFFPALGRAIPITPSTVAGALTLHRPLFEGRLEMARTADPDRSPRGTAPDPYLADGVEFELAGVADRQSAVLLDMAEYGDVDPSDLGTYGMLGYDWMKPRRAILDYANRRLHFRPQAA